MIVNWINKWIISVFYFIFIFELSQIMALRMSSISVPKIADVRDIIRLSCSYNMGAHKLNSVKWYKDGMEFFRYSPMTYPSIMTFPVVGVNLPISTVDQIYNCNHETCTITLEQLSSKSSGEYRCEISGDAPEFKLISDTANMTIGAIPRINPLITGLSTNYMDGDFVFANCTSDMSSPAANLMWYINNERAPTEYLEPQRETTIDTDGFTYRYRSLEIHFHADKSRYEYSGGLMKLQCVARIDQIPSATRDTSMSVYITSMAELKNQKLVNWMSTANSLTKLQTKWISVSMLIVLYFILNLLVSSTGELR